MYQDKRVWDVEHVPNVLQRRRAELESLASVAGAAQAGYPKNAHLVGPSGTGKTAAVRSLVRQTDRGLDTQYVDVWDQRTAKRTLWRVLTGAVPSTETAATPDSTKDELLKEIVDAVDGPYLVVLDEADMLGDLAIIERLQEIPDLALVFVTNRRDALQPGIDRGDTIPFERYSRGQLVDILQPRVERGLSSGAAPEAIVHRVARDADGDARTAIKTMDFAARFAIDADVEEISDAHVDDALPAARQYIRQKASDRLRRHERILYRVIREHGPIQMGKLHAEYTTRLADRGMDDPRTKRTCRRYLAKMVDYHLISEEGGTAGRTYRPVMSPTVPTV